MCVEAAGDRAVCDVCMGGFSQNERYVEFDGCALCMNCFEELTQLEIMEYGGGEIKRAAG